MINLYLRILSVFLHEKEQRITMQAKGPLYPNVLGVTCGKPILFLIFKPLSDTPLQADRLCVVTSSLRALALAPGMFFDHAVFALRDQLSALDAK